MNRWNFSIRLSSFAFRAADWNLNEPTWNGRMRMVSGAQLNIKLEDKMSGQLFANCPVEAYPGWFKTSSGVSNNTTLIVLRCCDWSCFRQFTVFRLANPGRQWKICFHRNWIWSEYSTFYRWRLPILVWSNSFFPIKIFRTDQTLLTSTLHYKTISNTWKMQKLSKKKRQSQNHSLI